MNMNYRSIYNVHFTLLNMKSYSSIKYISWNRIFPLPFWELLILNLMSVLWSQSPQSFARLFLLSAFAHQVLRLADKSCVRKACHLITWGQPAAPKPPMNRGRRLGMSSWRENHFLDQGRTNRTWGELVKNVSALALCSKSDFSAPFQSLLSVCHGQMTSVTCDAGQGQSPYGSHTLSSTSLPGPCLFPSLCVPCQTFTAHRRCVLSPFSSLALQ